MKSARTHRRVARVQARLDKYDAWTPTLHRLVEAGRYQDAARTLRQYSIHGTFTTKQKQVIQQAIEALTVLHKSTHTGRIETPYIHPIHLIRRDLRSLPGQVVETPPARKRASVASPRALRSHRLSITSTPPARFAWRSKSRRSTLRTPKPPTRIAPTPRIKPVPAPKPRPLTVTRVPTPDPKRPAKPTHPKVYETIKRLEGLPRNRDPGLRYKNIRGIGTIGYGHMITSQSPVLFRKLFGPDFNAQAVVQGKKPLTKAQYERLLEHDVDVRVDEVRARLPDYDTWPPRVQAAVMQAKFRGDLGPKTTRHLKNGNFKAAAQEIVRTSEYRRPGNEGITRRLDEAASAFKNYAAKPTPAPTPAPAPTPVPAPRKRLRNRVANAGRVVQKRASNLGTQARRMAKHVETRVREERAKVPERRREWRTRINQARKKGEEVVTAVAQRAKVPERRREWSTRVDQARKRGEEVVTAVAQRARPLMDQTAARARAFGDQVRQRAQNARSELNRRTKPVRNRVERMRLPRA